MPKRKEPELTAEEQSERFKEAARKVGITKNEKEFEKAFDKVASPLKERAPKRKTD